VLTLLYYVEEGSTVILEQPEIHLHPLAQAGLADAILKCCQRRNLQVIVESHSEHFLLRLQRRVAEGCVGPDRVRLFFCDTDPSASRLLPLELDLYGRITNWPRNFLGNAFGETAAAEKARLARQLQDS
jgi:predicted ATPase